MANKTDKRFWNVKDTSWLTEVSMYVDHQSESQMVYRYTELNSSFMPYYLSCKTKYVFIDTAQ